MSPLHSLAKSCIAPIFVTGGVDSLRHPQSKLLAADKVADSLRPLGLNGSTVQLVRINGGVQIAAGLLLFTGRLPRLASAALAVSLVPTTLAGHRFWEESDPAMKAQQRTQFMKNMALFGGLLLAATDRNGSPSLTWRAKRQAHNASSSMQAARSSFVDHVSHDSVGDRVGSIGEKLRDVAGPLVERGFDLAGDLGSALSDHAARVGDNVQGFSHSLR